MAVPFTREHRFGRKARSEYTTFAYPATAMKQTPLKTLTRSPPPLHVFQDGWSGLGLVSQIAFKFLLNLDRGTHGKYLLTQAISLKLVFAYIQPETNNKAII